MDGDDPVGGKWNFDAENREPPPKDAVGGQRRYATLDRLDDIASLRARAAEVIARVGRGQL